MARAKVRTRHANRWMAHGHTFRKDRDTIVTDESVIKLLEGSNVFRVQRIEVAEMAKEPEPVESFTVFEEPEPKKELSYHELMLLRKAQLQEMAYEMGAIYAEDATKRNLVEAIIKKRSQNA